MVTEITFLPQSRGSCGTVIGLPKGLWSTGTAVEAGAGRRCADGSLGRRRAVAAPSNGRRTPEPCRSWSPRSSGARFPSSDRHRHGPGLPDRLRGVAGRGHRQGSALPARDSWSARATCWSRWTRVPSSPPWRRPKRRLPGTRRRPSSSGGAEAQRRARPARASSPGSSTIGPGDLDGGPGHRARRPGRHPDSQNSAFLLLRLRADQRRHWSSARLSPARRSRPTMPRCWW